MKDLAYSQTRYHYSSLLGYSFQPITTLIQQLASVDNIPFWTQ